MAIVGEVMCFALFFCISSSDFDSQTYSKIIMLKALKKNLTMQVHLISQREFKLGFVYLIKQTISTLNSYFCCNSPKKWSCLKCTANYLIAQQPFLLCSYSSLSHLQLCMLVCTCHVALLVYSACHCVTSYQFLKDQRLSWFLSQYYLSPFSPVWLLSSTGLTWSAYVTYAGTSAFLFLYKKKRVYLRSTWPDETAAALGRVEEVRLPHVFTTK